MQVRMLSARGAYGYPPHIPPRASDTRSSLSSGFTASSPPRKVVTDFAAFGASRSSTVYGTAVQSTPFSLAGNKAAFGSIRTTAQASVYDDDDEEEEQSDGRQRVLLREDPITLDQVTLFFFFVAVLDSRWERFRLGVSPCRAHGVAPEASVPVAYPQEAVDRFLIALVKLCVIF